MSGYCRVTVTGPQRWADLALPGTVPVASLLPQVVRVCSPETDGLEPAGWTLTTAGGAAVRPDSTLEHAGVLDGDVLLLRRETAPERPAFVDDVRGAVEDRVDGAARIWRAPVGLAFGLVLAAVGPLLLAAAMAVVRQSPIDLAVAPVGLLVSLGALWLAARRSMTGVAHAVLAAACGWGALTAALAALQISGSAAPAPVVPAAFACAGALAAAAAGWWVHSTALPYLAALGVAAVAAGVLVAVGLFVDGPLGTRVMAVLLVLGVGALPRLALSMGGLSGLDYEVRHVGQTDTARFEESMANSDRLLLGALLGSVATAVAMVLLLVATGDGRADLVLAALVSFVLLMRSRLFDRVRHVLPLRVGGVLGLAAAAVGAAAGTELMLALLPAAALATGAAAAAVSWVEPAEVPRASLRRILNGVEVVAVVGLCVATAWALGLYALVTSISPGA
ncbi:hypothetical protein GCM10023224_10900 [Streptomonospora halophila]|uniref:EccD-like transmembrane domain-containing protein n=1 Tax=Streptomonospora halophila TaxID=427369 RepID=A0ABP9G865_9ACTN